MCDQAGSLVLLTLLTGTVHSMRFLKHIKPTTAAAQQQAAAQALSKAAAAAAGPVTKTKPPTMP